MVVGTEAETLDLVLDTGQAGQDQGRRLHLRRCACCASLVIVLPQSLAAGRIHKVEPLADDGHTQRGNGQTFLE
jgi:hypothetical protein